MLGSVRLRGHGRAHFPLLRAAHLPGRAARLLTRRSDALLELANALLCAPAIPSLAHLSLEVVHQRGWGSTYAALAHGRVDVQAPATCWPATHFTTASQSTQSMSAPGP